MVKRPGSGGRTAAPERRDEAPGAARTAGILPAFEAIRSSM